MISNDMLRKAWVAALAAAILVGGAAALAMRIELLDPGPTFTIDHYGEALTLHAVVLVGTLLGILVAMPSLVLRVEGALGIAALAVWGVAVTWLAIVAVTEPMRPTHVPLYLLAGAALLGIAQAALELPRQRVAAGGAIAALVIVLVPVVRGGLPGVAYWLAATAVLAATCRPERALPEAAVRSGAATLRMSVPVVLIVAAATAAAYGESAPTTYFSDTVGIVAPFPALGGALLAVLVSAVVRVHRPRLAIAGAAAFTCGVLATSAGFLLLGMRGMPRRYYQYDPQFQPLQIVVGIAALISIVGGVLTVIACRADTRR